MRHRAGRDLEKRDRLAEDTAWAQLMLDIEYNERIVDGLPELDATGFADLLKEDKHQAHYGRELNVPYKALRLALRKLAQVA